MSTGQGVIGCNMFCYCLNNPVCRCDKEGTWSFTQLALNGAPVTYIETPYGDKPYPNKAESYMQKCHDFFNPPCTQTISLSLGGNLGFYSGYVSFGYASGQYISAKESNSGFFWSYGAGIGTLDASANISISLGRYDTPNYKDAMGRCIQTGLSVSYKIASFSFDKAENGSSISIGVSKGLAPIHIHHIWTNSIPIEK